MADTTPIAGIPFAELGDSPNANSLSEGMANALDHLVIPKYASVAARNAANPSPSTGDTCYRTDQKIHQAYNGADWIDVTERYKRMTSNQTSSSTTLVDITPLNIAVDSNSVYEFELNFGYSVNTASDFKYTMDAPVGATAISVYNINFTSTDTFGFDFQDTFTLGTTTIICGGLAGNKLVAQCWGMIQTSSTAGNFTPNMAVNVGGNTLTVYAGSYFKVRQVG